MVPFVAWLEFYCRYLPSEIGCLKKLEYLDLSFNKMKNLPTEIGNLSELISLKVANNKLVELPPALSSLQRLESLDVSNNRLTSLGSLELGSMHSLQNLNIQVLTCYICNLVLVYVNCSPFEFHILLIVCNGSIQVIFLVQCFFLFNFD